MPGGGSRDGFAVESNVRYGNRGKVSKGLEA